MIRVEPLNRGTYRCPVGGNGETNPFLADILFGFHTSENGFDSVDRANQFDFDTAITLYEPNRVIGWRTEPGALIQHAGIVRFSEEPNGTTRADVKMTYNPVAGAVGHVIAKLFGSDAKRQIDDDLARMKSYIETGKQPPDAAEVEQRPSV